MTVGVDDELRIREYPGDNTATPRAYGFKILDPDDLRVIRTNADASETVLVRGTDYSVSGAGNPTGGNVTPLAPIAAGTSWRIEGDMSLGQPTDYTAGDDFPSESHERGLDRSMIAHQEARRDLNDTVARALMVPRGEASPMLPAAAARQGKFLAFDAGGDPIPASGTGSDGALREDLADDTGLQLLGGAPGFATARAELDSKGPVATKSSAVDALMYPVDFRLGRDHAPVPFEFIPANQHAAIIFGNSTYGCSADLQKMMDGWNPAQGKSGLLPFPPGRFYLDEEVLFPNWIGWQGHGRSTMIVPHPDFVIPVTPDIPTAMLRFDSDPGKVLNGPDPDYPSSQFENRLMNMDIDGNGFTGLNTMIYAPSWNEKSGLYNILMRRCGTTALHVDEFHGGSAGWAIDHCEFMFTADATIGLRLYGKARGGGLIGNLPQIKMGNVSIVGGVGVAEDASAGFIAVEADNLHLQLAGAVHLEKAWIGILVDHAANLTGYGLTGSDGTFDEPRGRVKEMVGRGPNHTGQIALRNVSPGTATGARALRDFKTSHNITTPIGGALTIPSLPGEACCDGTFDVNGVPDVSASTLRGIASVVRAGAGGYYQATFVDAFATGADYRVRAWVHDDTTACVATVRGNDRSGANFYIRVNRVSDGAAFDPTQVSFEVYRKPGL